MKRHFPYVLLAVSAFFLTPLANAQSAAPERADAHAPAASGATIAPVNAPANVLDGESGDVPGWKPGTSCRNDPLTGEIPVQCRRWSEIASYDSVTN